MVSAHTPYLCNTPWYMPSFRVPLVDAPYYSNSYGIRCFSSSRVAARAQGPLASRVRQPGHDPICCALRAYARYILYTLAFPKATCANALLPGFCSATRRPGPDLLISFYHIIHIPFFPPDALEFNNLLFYHQIACVVVVVCL